MLRSCNELLRRLSRAEEAVFCGRVFIFLFQSFPLGDKSAVNLRGEFHTENITNFEESSQPQHADGQDAMVIDDGADFDLQDHNDTLNESREAQDNQSKAPERYGSRQGKERPGQHRSTPVPSQPDADKQKEKDSLQPENLYSVFWSLQQDFSNPPRVFDQNEFESFQQGLDLTLKKFKSMPKVPHVAINEAETGAKRKRHQDTEEFASAFNPKYLTSQDLFELEMSDLTFQRHILVQALILLDFLLSLTPKAKAKVAQLKPQKALDYKYTLSDENTAWVTSMRSRIVHYLKEGPDGAFYYRMVDNVLSRDKNWVRWKVESCPPIERPPVSTDEFLEAKSSAKRACTNKRLRAVPLGSIDLSFLSDDANVNSMDTLKNTSRYIPPSIETLLDGMDEIDEELEAKTKEKEIADKEVEDGEAEYKKFRPEQERFEREQRIFEIEQRKLAAEHKTHQADQQKVQQRDELKKQRLEKRTRMEEARVQRRERSDTVAVEWAGIEADRSSRTWRALRLAAKQKIRLLDRIDERKSLKILVDGDAAKEDFQKQETPMPENVQEAHTNGIKTEEEDPPQEGDMDGKGDTPVANDVKEGEGPESQTKEKSEVTATDVASKPEIRNAQVEAAASV